MASRKHPIQSLMDNPWLLLFLGIAVTALSYTAWGWFELARLATATLP